MWESYLIIFYKQMYQVFWLLTIYNKIIWFLYNYNGLFFNEMFNIDQMESFSKRLFAKLTDFGEEKDKIIIG